MIVVGAPVGGLLGDAVGYRPMLLAAAGGFLVVTVALGLSRFRDTRITEAPAWPVAPTVHPALD